MGIECSLLPGGVLVDPVPLPNEPERTLLYQNYDHQTLFDVMTVYVYYYARACAETSVFGKMGKLFILSPFWFTFIQF